MKTILHFLFFLSLLAKTSYEGYQVIQVMVETKEQLLILQELEHDAKIDMWNQYSLGPAMFSISPSHRKQVILSLKENKIGFVVAINNLQRVIEEQEQLQLESPSGFFSKFQTLESILEYIGKLTEKYPTLASGFSIGKSYEGREIKGIRIKGNIQNINNVNAIKTPKKIIFHGGIHAREWIGPAVVTYIATQLLEKYSTDNNIKNIVDNFEFHIIPVLNVDGYQFTHRENRMWRKNRQPTGSFWCTGIDLNRNWDSGWSGPGASSNPCSDAYHGPAPFSGVESRLISTYIKENEFLSYVDFHAFSQLWMYPWGWECQKDAPTADKMKKIASIGAKAVKKVHGTGFAVGSICKIIYQASGSSVDWAYEKGGVEYPFAIELRDTGRYGFLLPPKQIIPSGEEMFEGVVAYVTALLQ